MKTAFLNSVLPVVLFLACSSGLQAQESKSPTPPSQPPAARQPQNEPGQPNQTPQQEPPKEAPQTQPPNTAQPQTEPGQTAPDQQKPAEKPQSGAPQAAPSNQPSPSTPSKPHTTTKSKSRKKKTTTGSKTQSTTDSGKVVVRNGGARDSTAQISPGVNDQQAQNQRNVTNQLLATTDANLKEVSGKQLTPAQQSMLDQVNSYVRQSKAAADAGDVSRAHMLAVKAQLLSNELARK